MATRFLPFDPAEPGPAVLGGLLAAGLLAAFPAFGPALLALAAVMVVEWVRARLDAEVLKAAGVGALVGLAAAKGMLETAGLPAPYLDGAWRTGAFVAAVPLVLGLLEPVLEDGSARARAAAGLSLLAGTIALLIA